MRGTVACGQAVPGVQPILFLLLSSLLRTSPGLLEWRKVPVLTGWLQATGFTFLRLGLFIPSMGIVIISSCNYESLVPSWPRVMAESVADTVVSYILAKAQISVV